MISSSIFVPCVVMEKKKKCTLLLLSKESSCFNAEEHENAIGLTVRENNLRLGDVCSSLLVTTYQAAFRYHLNKVNLADLEI